MFCYQCEQSAKGGCKVVGVCGKSDNIGKLDDLLIHQLKVIASIHQQKNIVPLKTTSELLENGLFTVVTNVNFDETRMLGIIKKNQTLLNELYKQFPDITPVFKASLTLPEAAEQAEKLGILSLSSNEDIRSLKSILQFGLEGMAAYANHARILGSSGPIIDAFFIEALAAIIDPNQNLDSLVALNLKCGEVNIKCMEILSNAHTSRYGHPVPTAVQLGVKKGPAILVSGHDLYDLEQLLIQTEGKGITVYTHGEMLPTHGYPGLKKYAHLYGNFGSAWQNQLKEFATFPGSILMTTNCIQKPAATYMSNIYTSGQVAWPGVKHIANHDYSELIARALELGGFPEDKPGQEILVGFGHNAVLGVADKVIEAVKAGQIRHFFLVGGCDGAKPGRNYYTEFVEQAPKDTVILTLACGKFRFNTMELGTIGGIPRLLDIGQCNDAYSAVQIALALASAFNVSVNELPLSFILSWYEQKAVVILLSLFSLGIKNIKLGPTLPAFITPNVLDVLVKNFNVGPITTPEADLAEALAK